MRSILIILAFAAALGAANLEAQADPFLIVPGRSIGQTHLGRNGVYYLRNLPSPDGSDAAMGGKRWMAWKSKTSRGTLAVSAVSREFDDPPQPGMTLLEIRVTSPRFHTRSGVWSGATLTQIRRHFPLGHLEPANDNTAWFYTLRQGIAFEFARRPSAGTRCIAVSVYPPGLGTPILTSAVVRDLLHSGARP